jgi:hypothetical protein
MIPGDVVRLKSKQAPWMTVLGDHKTWRPGMGLGEWRPEPECVVVTWMTPDYELQQATLPKAALEYDTEAA